MFSAIQCKNPTSSTMTSFLPIWKWLAFAPLPMSGMVSVKVSSRMISLHARHKNGQHNRTRPHADFRSYLACSFNMS